MNISEEIECPKMVWIKFVIHFFPHSFYPRYRILEASDLNLTTSLKKKQKKILLVSQLIQSRVAGRTAKGISCCKFIFMP